MGKPLDKIVKGKNAFMSWMDLESIYKIHILTFDDCPNLRGHEKAFYHFFDWYLLNFDVERENRTAGYDPRFNSPKNIKKSLGPGEVVTNLDVFLESPATIKVLTDDERNIMKKWKHKNPSVYRIVEVYQEMDEPRLKAVDIFSDSEYLVNLKEVFKEGTGFDEFKGAIFIAILVESPLENEYIPFSSFDFLPGSAEENIFGLINEYWEEIGQRKIKNFSHTSAKYLIAGFFRIFEMLHLKEMYTAIKEGDWKKEVYKQVAIEFMEGILYSEFYSSKSVFQAIDAWFKFSGSEMPDIRNAGGMAASLEYFVAKSEWDSHLKDVTQEKLAEEYETSPATISKNYNLLKEYYDEYLAGDKPDLEGSPKNLDEEDAKEIINDLLEYLDMDSEEQLESIEKGMEKAKELVKKAKEEKDLLKKIQLLYNATEFDPTCSEAYILMAETSEIKEFSLGAYELAKKSAEKKPENLGIYVEASIRSALIRKDTAEVETIIEELKEVLKVAKENKLDGYKKEINYLLVPLLLQAERLNEARELITTLERYGTIRDAEDDSTVKRGSLFSTRSTILAYSKILYHYLQHGFSEKETLHELIKEAWNINPVVLDYLDNLEKLPEMFPIKHWYTKETEGIGFLKLSSKAWERYPELSKYIKDYIIPDQMSLEKYLTDT